MQDAEVPDRIASAPPPSPEPIRPVQRHEVVKPDSPLTTQELTHIFCGAFAAWQIVKFYRTYGFPSFKTLPAAMATLDTFAAIAAVVGTGEGLAAAFGKTIDDVVYDDIIIDENNQNTVDDQITKQNTKNVGTQMALQALLFTGAASVFWPAEIAVALPFLLTKIDRDDWDYIVAQNLRMNTFGSISLIGAMTFVAGLLAKSRKDIVVE